MPIRRLYPGLSGTVIDEQPRAYEAVFGEVEGEFVLSVGLGIADGIRWLQRRQVMRLGQQAGEHRSETDRTGETSPRPHDQSCTRQRGYCILPTEITI